MDTFNSQNFMGYAQSAGNLSFLLCLGLLNLAREGGVSGSSNSSISGEKMQGASSPPPRYATGWDRKKTEITCFAQSAGNYSKVILFAICWNSLVSIGTFNSQNLIGYAQSAGNVLSYLITCTLADLNDPVALLCLVPVISYSNADTKKEQILRENKEKSGIYI